MRILFEIDTKDYDRKGTVFERPSARETEVLETLIREGYF